jgi:hypothetical protein
MADDINSFLNSNQVRNNRNLKFNDSSPTSSVFGRLGFDFIPSNPAFLELSASVKENLLRMPKLLSDWQAEDLRTGTVNRVNYYRNPVGDVSNAIKGYLQSIVNSIPVQQYYYSEGSPPITQIMIPSLSETYTLANVAIIETQKFVDHTNRLSNVVDVNPDTAEYPHFQQAMAVGRQLMYIVYQTDDIQNNSPIIGTFTSIFIEPELSQLSNTISAYPFLIANSISSSFIGEDFLAYSTSLTPTQIEGINSTLRQYKNLIERRRRHDENFWEKSKQITDEYQLLRSMSGGETQQRLINDYVGTEEFIEKLQIRDVPSQPLYNISMAWDGTITYTPVSATGNVIIIPSVEVRDEPIQETAETFDELPLDGNVVGDQYYITTTGETWSWNGNQWVLISQQDPVSPTLTLDEYIDFYSNNSLNVAFSGYSLRMSPAAIKFVAENGKWSSNTTIQITNIGTKDYVYSNVTATNFLNSEIRYTFNPTSNVIGIGNTVTFNVSARNLAEGNTIDYGVITIVPGLKIQSKLTSTEVSYGILLPSEISHNVGTSLSRLPINTQTGPYPILAPTSESPDFWTWRNLSESPVTISSIINISSANTNAEMNISFYQANTPNTINVNSSVLWYANVRPNIEFPNVQTFLVTTTDGQQRLMKIGIDRGNVDDSNLYNEIINSNPSIVVTNSAFSLRVFGAKPNTLVTISGPTTTNVLSIPANGNVVLANNVITANGTYTWIFDFAGTSHRRTITRAIFAS